MSIAVAAAERGLQRGQLQRAKALLVSANRFGTMGPVMHGMPRALSPPQPGPQMGGRNKVFLPGDVKALDTKGFGEGMHILKRLAVTVKFNIGLEVFEVMKGFDNADPESAGAAVAVAEALTVAVAMAVTAAAGVGRGHGRCRGHGYGRCHGHGHSHGHTPGHTPAHSHGLAMAQPWLGHGLAMA